VRCWKRFIRAAALPVGPSLDRQRGLLGRASCHSLYKWRAKSALKEKPFRINGKWLSAEFRSAKQCCALLHRTGNRAVSLCSAKK
jgi:hypothetical protein